MNFYFELQALIEVAVGDDFNDNEWEWLIQRIFSCNHSFDLAVVNSELLFWHFVWFFGDLFYIKIEFFCIFYGKVNVEREETHESEHDFFL